MAEEGEGMATHVAKLEDQVEALERIVRKMLHNIGQDSSDFEQFQWYARRLFREMRRDVCDESPTDDRKT